MPPKQEYRKPSDFDDLALVSGTPKGGHEGIQKRASKGVHFAPLYIGYVEGFKRLSRTRAAKGGC